MKFYQIILYLFPLITFGQTCDTLFSHENYIERKLEINFRDCFKLDVDSSYSINQMLIGNNSFTEHICYSLFHSINKNLIQERWEIDDTTYFKSYSGSGKIKSFSKSVFRVQPYYFHEIKQDFYENGQLKYEGEYKSLSFTWHNSYYSSGQLETRAQRFSYNPNQFGEYLQYFPNGQISARQVFSLPDTTTDQFQKSELIDESYFNLNGKEIDQNDNEFKRMTVKLFPSDGSTTPPKVAGLFTHQQFQNQEAYSGDMFNLKNRIYRNLEISEKCNCTKGIVWISLIITDKSKIEIREIDFKDKSLTKKIKKSIKKVDFWPAAIHNGAKVNTLVYTYLIIDK